MYDSTSKRYFTEDHKYFLSNNKLICSWLKGDISGKLCVKQLIDMSVKMTTGFVGSMIIVSLGSHRSVTHMLIGCVICGTVISEVAGTLSNRVTSILLSESIKNSDS